MALKKMKNKLFLILSGLRPSRMTIAKLSPLSHAVAIGSMIFLSACGDDGSSSKGTEPTDDSASSSTVGDIMAGTFDDLPVCTAKREGVMAYVKDEKTAYVCEDGDWVIDSDVIPSSDPESSNGSAQSSSGNGKTKSSSSVKAESSSSVTPGSDPESSSSLKVAASSSALSSSIEGRGSSSSVKIASSSSNPSSSWSSEGTVGSSSSKGKTNSSSSVKAESSSSVIPSSAPESSSSQKVAVSSSALSSSNEVKVSSSSSVKSSSVDVVDPADVIVGSMTDSRDGKTYKTVKIGSQIWMAENLNYDYEKRSLCGGGTRAPVDDCSHNGFRYGRLYTWAEAMDSAGSWSTNGMGCGYGSSCSPIYPVRGVCPSGWHLPSDTEWNTLFTAVGGIAVGESSTAGRFLMSTSGWTYCKGTDAFSFSAVPAGGGFSADSDYYLEWGAGALFWSSTESRYSRAAGYAYLVELFNCYATLTDLNYPKNNLHSVRCIQN